MAATDGGRAGAGYAAFISYSHADDDVSEWLHRRLEGYAVPRSLQARPRPGGGLVGRRLGKVFRDRAEFGAHHDLGAEIRKALDVSDALIVLCSPRAAGSPYVQEEIRHFKATGRGERIFAAIVAGEPHAAGKPGLTADDECFPPALIYALDASGAVSTQPEAAEPIAADFRNRKDGRENGALKLIAGLLDIGLDELVQREKQAERARRLRANLIAGAMAVLAAGAAVGATFAFINGAAAARRAEELKTVNASLEERKSEVERQNTQLGQQRDALDAQLKQITRLSTQMSSVVSEIAEIASTEPVDENKLLLLSYGARVGASADSLFLFFEFEFGPGRDLGVQPGYGAPPCLGGNYCGRDFTVEQLRADWTGRLPAEAVERIAAAWSPDAQEAQRALRDIRVPRKEAIRVFGEKQLPRYVETVRRVWPGAEALAPDSIGALISILIHVGPKRLEALGKEVGGDQAKAPAAIIAFGQRDAARLQPRQIAEGLMRRREREAALFQQGLDQAAQAAPQR